MRPSPLATEVSFDEQTGARSKSLRHAVLSRVLKIPTRLSLDFDPLRLLQFVANVHAQGVALCSIGPSWRHKPVDFGLCRPLDCVLGSDPPGDLENVVCVEPLLLSGACGASPSTAELFDTWSLGVTLAAPHAEVQIEPVQPLNLLRRRIHNCPYSHQTPDRYLLQATLQANPSDRTEIRRLAAAFGVSADPGLVLPSAQSVIARGLTELEQLVNDEGEDSCVWNDAITLLRIKLDLTLHVLAADRAAAGLLCSLRARHALLSAEKCLLAKLGSILLDES